MKKYFYLLALALSQIAFAQYADPNYAIPATGYGSDGSHTVAVETFANVNFAGHTINIYHPGDISTPVPTIFYSHAYGGNDPENIIGMLEFVAKKGYAIVYVPYQTLATTTIQQRYDNLKAGFRKAAQDYPNIISTDKVGFMGHSFGGGASFAIAQELFTNDGWGTNGRFIYALAQWYSYFADNSLLDNYPDNTKVLIEVFADDSTNDHRMAIDVFNHLNVSAAEKDYVLVSSSTVNGYNYEATHSLPNTATAFDALDYYAYYRFIDALADYAFNGNTAGKDVALGHGSTAQVTMPGEMTPLQSFSNPYPLHLQSYYEFPCNNADDNPRIDYCTTTAGIEEISNNVVSIYPNPATEVINITTTLATLSINIYSTMGQQVNHYELNQNAATINMQALPKGMYLVEVNGIAHKVIRN
ncbi:T9SS type A sorting domain-containing protein [Flavobacterium sp. RHBU_3]|uniref:T9SS type A sorting domain-containing protein n=1 Tax=Flavobacterium sp. RHBU_3 TaxID=3391184 RepID=UPI003985221B